MQNDRYPRKPRLGAAAWAEGARSHVEADALRQDRPRLGTFELGCAQHCGVSHYKMHGDLYATPDAEWRAWQARAAEDARLRYDAKSDAAAEAWDWDQG